MAQKQDKITRTQKYLKFRLDIFRQLVVSYFWCCGVVYTITPHFFFNDKSRRTENIPIMLPHC